MKLWKQAVVCAVVLGAAAALWARNFPTVAALLERSGLAVASVERDAPQEQSRPGGGGPPAVIGVAVVQATINDSLSAIGDGRAARSVTVTPYASGRIATVEVASGDLVKAGAPLARLDSEAEEIALDRARLTLQDARDKLARDEALARSRAISEVQLRQDQLAVGQAELALRDAELALERRVIRAPFDGWVGILGVDLGDQVGTETAIATMDDRSRILVDFRVPERFIGQIRVRASLENPDDLLRAGMAFSISMRFPGDTFPAVDPLAIQWSGSGAYVWTGEGGRATQVPVRIMQRNNDYVLVDADLAPGTLVVTEGVQLLRPGAPMRFENAPPEATVEETPGDRGEAGAAAAAPRKT